MTKRLSDEDIRKAVLILDSWSNKLTWGRFLAILENEIGRKYSKPAMHQHSRIANAFAQAKARIREGVQNASGDGIGVVRHGDVALARANGKIKELKARTDRLEMENRDLLEMFRRWQYNAHISGLAIEVLDRSLPQTSKKPGS